MKTLACRIFSCVILQPRTKNLKRQEPIRDAATGDIEEMEVAIIEATGSPLYIRKVFGNRELDRKEMEARTVPGYRICKVTAVTQPSIKGEGGPIITTTITEMAESIEAGRIKVLNHHKTKIKNDFLSVGYLYY